MDANQDTPTPQPADPQRRSFLSSACSAAMGAGLLASYGTLGAYAARYLYPAKSQPKGWMYVTQAAAMKKGDAARYITPNGAAVTIIRQSESGDKSGGQSGGSGGAEDFIALSSTCPHLGCKVHWEQQNNRFFCPCHNGAFDPTGQPTAGPPADAGQALPQYALKIENGLLYILVQTTGLG